MNRFSHRIANINSRIDLFRSLISEWVTEEKLVSIDFNHNSNSAIVDLSLTNVVGDKMGKVSAWYDNEWGFASRMCDLVEYIHII